jgi:5-methylcytosine-specific restriction protein B
MYGLKVPTTFVKAAEIILFANNQPMKIQEIAKIITEKNMVETSGETPERTLSTEFLRDRENGENSKFIQTGSATYVLRRQIIQDGTDVSQDSTTDSSTKKSNFMQQVTFHQSFSYEEFIEGIKAKPTADGGGVTYDIDKGIFRRFCLRAQKDDKNNYVMIIDEINRGNISKIFGELITIIEKDKRGERVTLAYSRDDFWVPENVFIIGTMNTADQSLTHLDAALKRRFTMMETPPDSNILKHSKVEGVDLTNLLDAINKKLVEYKFRDRRIGHAYFMTKDENSGETEIIKKIEDLQMAFATDIIPVLRDHFYDQEDILMDVLGNEFLDWENDQDLKEDWQEDKEIFKEILKKAYGV